MKISVKYDTILVHVGHDAPVLMTLMHPEIQASNQVRALETNNIEPLYRPGAQIDPVAPLTVYTELLDQNLLSHCLDYWDLLAMQRVLQVKEFSGKFGVTCLCAWKSVARGMVPDPIHWKDDVLHHVTCFPYLWANTDTPWDNRLHISWYQIRLATTDEKPMLLDTKFRAGILKL